VPHYKMLVMSRPVAGREEDYNDWYQNIHLAELTALPGFRSARRYRLARTLVEGDAHPYLAVYDIETEDIDAVLDRLRSAAAQNELDMSDSLDTSDTRALVYEVFGEEVSKR